jgi:ABC-type phosphate transport system permease subunit
MEPTDAEKLKARRVQQLLYVLIALMIGIPTVIFILQTFR